MTGQLNLFKGKRQRGTQPPPPKEFASHVFLADVIRRWIMPNWKWTHMPLGEEREHRVDPKTGKRYSLAGARLKRMGVTPGWPDFMFVGPGRAMFWLELKRQGSGRMSVEQSEIAIHLMACGHSYMATSSVSDAIAEMKDLGILQKGFEVQ
jgi:hypothetical protein